MNNNNITELANFWNQTINKNNMENTTQEKSTFKVPTFDNLIINEWDVILIAMPTEEEGIAANANIILQTPKTKEPKFVNSRPFVICKVGNSIKPSENNTLFNNLKVGSLVYMRNGFEHDSDMIAVNEHKAWLNPIITNSTNIRTIETNTKWLEEYAELQTKIENFVNTNQESLSNLDIKIK